MCRFVLRKFHAVLRKFVLCWEQTNNRVGYTIDHQRRWNKWRCFCANEWKITQCKQMLSHAPEWHNWVLNLFYRHQMKWLVYAKIGVNLVQYMYCTSKFTGCKTKCLNFLAYPVQFTKVVFWLFPCNTYAVVSCQLKATVLNYLLSWYNWLLNLFRRHQRFYTANWLVLGYDLLDYQPFKPL